MAKKQYGVRAFETMREFADLNNRVGRTSRRSTAEELGISIATLVRIMSDADAQVRRPVRAALERCLPKWAGIILTKTAVAPAKQLSESRGNDKLLTHLRDALLEATAACDDAAKLSAALNALLGGGLSK